MKKYLILSILLVTVAAFAGASVIASFSVSGQGDKAVLEWLSGIEGNLIKYKIERSENNLNFTAIQEIFPGGNFSSYQFIDDDVMKLSSQRIFYYRIKMIFADNTSAYSEVKSVTLSFSGLQETWGSIKAMFR